MRFLPLLAGFFLLSTYTYAQDTTFIPHDLNNPALAIKVELLNSIVPFKQHASLGFDFRLHNRLSLDVMAGSYFHSIIFANRERERYLGPRLRVGVHHLLYESAHEAFYIGIQVKSDYIFHHENVQISRQGGQYREMYLLKREVLDTGLGVILSGRTSLTRNKKFFVNYFIGCGAQRLQISSNWPDDGEFIGRLMTQRRSDGILFLPYFTGGIQLGYILR